MGDVIMDASDLAEELDPDNEIGTADLTATEAPQEGKMNFHVHMSGYTMGDFEEMVVHAAAQKLLQSGGRPNMQQDIQSKVIEETSKELDAKLKPIVSDLMEMPVASKFGSKESDKPMTLGEYLGIITRDFLTTKVTHTGEVAGRYDRGEPRINRLIAEVIDQKLKKEMEAAVLDVRKELAKQARSKLDEMINEERKRIADAIGYEIKVRR